MGIIIYFSVSSECYILHEIVSQRSYTYNIVIYEKDYDIQHVGWNKQSYISILKNQNGFCFSCVYIVRKLMCVYHVTVPAQSDNK